MKKYCTLAFSFPESILNLDFLAGKTPSIRVSMHLGTSNASCFLSSIVFLREVSKYLLKYKSR